jgi:hypothetical protein
MESAGFVRRQQRRIAGQGSKTNIYHLDGLIAEATPYAKEKVQKREAKLAEQTASAKRKGKPDLKVVKNED